MKCLSIIITILILATHAFATPENRLLNSNWQFHKVGAKRWLPATVPGTIHTDLIDNHIIPDPFYRDNEKKVQWVSECDWEYKLQFETEADNYDDLYPIYLQFDGLDTYADVYLNDKLILQSDNMFRTYSIDISKHTIATNELRIVFHSATKYVDSLANLALPLIRPCENNRHYVRKAQYHFGWDWAPKLTTCGIWRDVQLIYHKPQAKQAQYSPVKLVQEKDLIGQSFYFTINDKPVFMKGANWVPADVFLPRIDDDKYRSLLLAAKEANFNMLRVWGGGIYEDDYFYELCDSLGIYVWQDFMFAGAMYPADEKSLENIKQEVIDNILRLRKHKCIVLWCGNNEIDEAWHNWGWQKQFHISNNDSIKLWKEYQKIFDDLLPSLVNQYDSGRQYIASSPLYGWGKQKSMTHGDSHYWGMWWGLDSINIMKQKVPRFMSEYGMQAMPNIESILQFTINSDLDTASAVMKLHQKHPTGYSTLHKYLLMENIQTSNFTSFIDATQELQSRALTTAIEAQRNSNGRCMGSILWQFNDCWPVCSWSIIDYYGRKKKAYESVKKAFQ